MSQMRVLDEFRRRVMSIRERARVATTERRLLHGQVFGEGKIIETIQQSVNNIVSIAKEKRPNIIPTAIERIKTYQPGKRIMELIPPKSVSAPAPSPVTTTTYAPTTERRMLRK
jgi:hypothetical protein